MQGLISRGEQNVLAILNRPYTIIQKYWADVSKAANVLHWQATRSLEDMCRDAWNWQQKNPNGYE